MGKILVLFSLLSVVLALGLGGYFTTARTQHASLEQVAPLKREALTLVRAADNGAFPFMVEIASSPMEQATGLMYRKAMPENEGMLFPFPEVREANFWMRNTNIPLDLIYIRQDGSIAKIVKSAKPMDETPMVSSEPVIAVLEINGGLSERFGFKIGDKVHSKTLGTQEKATP